MKKVINHLLVTKQNDHYVISPTLKLQNDFGTAKMAKFEVKTESEVSVNDLLLTIEASKAILYVRAPLKGKVLSVNEKLLDNPILLNSNKVEDNWIVKLTNVNLSDFKNA